jgi:hypothetical protein
MANRESISTYNWEVIIAVVDNAFDELELLFIGGWKKFHSGRLFEVRIS